MAATGELPERASGWKPGGTRSMRSPCDIHTGCRPAGSRGSAAQRLDLGRAVLARGGGRHRAAQGVRQRLHAVADAQDGQPGGQHVAGDLRRAGVVDRGRPAGQDEALAAAAPAPARPARPTGRARSRPALRARGGRSAARTASRNRGWRSSPRCQSAKTILPSPMSVMVASASIGTPSGASMLRPPSKIFSTSAPMPTTRAPAAWARRTSPMIV